MSSFDKVRKWAQAQIDNTAKPEVRPDIAVTVLQMIEQLETELEGEEPLPDSGKDHTVQPASTQA